MSGLVAVGVDAGGTTTRAVVSENGAVAGEAQGSGANATALGIDDAANAIVTVVRRALDHRKPDTIVVGAAGAGRLSVADALAAMIGNAFPDARVAVEGDTAIALRAAIPNGPGIVLIAGTGSTAYAENGDQRALGAADRSSYLDALYDAPLVPATIAALAPSIIAFAGKGNRAAAKIVQQAGLELGDLIKGAAKAVGLLEASPQVALAGGLFAENSLLSFLLETRIVGDLPGALVVRGGDAAETGALRIAQTLGVA